MNTNTRTVAVSTAVLAHVASLLPKIAFKDEWRAADGTYGNIAVDAAELPEHDMHASFDTDGRILLIVRYKDELQLMYQSQDRSMFLYDGDNDNLCELMEIKGPEISLYSLMLLFSYFGPETVVAYLSTVMEAETARVEGVSAEVPAAGNGGMDEVTGDAATTSDTAADPTPEGEQAQQKEEVDPELRKRIEQYATLGVTFIAGIVVGALAMRKFG